MLASMVRTTRSLAVAVALMLGGTASLAEAGGSAGTSASASILAPEAPPRLLRAAAGTSTVFVLRVCVTKSYTGFSIGCPDASAFS